VSTPDEQELNQRRAIRDALRGTTPDSYGPSPFAEAEALLRRKVPDLSEFELGFALYQGVPLQSLPPGLAIDAVARVRALRKAERAIGIPSVAFHEILRDLLPRLRASELSDADAIEAAVRRRLEALQQAAPAHRFGPSFGGYTEYDIRLAADKVRAGKQRPTLFAVAEELDIDESTLKRIVAKLKMGRWPPPPLHEGQIEPI
jgi:hypothetical protein